MEVKVGNAETDAGGRQVFVAVAGSETNVVALFGRTLDSVGRTRATMLTGFTDRCTGLRLTLTAAGVTKPPILDWFHLLAAPPAPGRRTLSLEGCRILAGQLRDAVEARQKLVAERAAASRACAFCLHRLLPVPDRLLRLGPEHPQSRAWLWANWGTTQALRGVVELPVPRRGQPVRRDPGLVWLGFWSADWTPWPAILALRARWPGLSITVRPINDDP